MELIAYAMNGSLGRFGPASLADSINHLRRNHIVGQFNRLSKFNELVGSKQFTAAEVQSDGDEMGQREPVGLGQRSGGEDRSEGPGFEPNHVRFAMAGAFREQDASKAVSNPIGEGEK